MIVADATGVPIDRIEVVHGDTDAVPVRRPDRRVALGATRRRRPRRGDRRARRRRPVSGRRTASRRTSATSCSTDGRFHVAGTPASSLGWDDLAEDADGRLARRARLRPARCRRFRSAPTSPSSRSTPRRARCGCASTSPSTTPARSSTRCWRKARCTAASPRASPRRCSKRSHYDADGQPRTTNFADYPVISAAELPSFDLVSMETPTFVNALGAKGVGESGTIGSIPAVYNAVIDALSHLGIRHLETPLTPERIWRRCTSTSVSGLLIRWRHVDTVDSPASTTWCSTSGTSSARIASTPR